MVNRGCIMCDDNDFDEENSQSHLHNYMESYRSLVQSNHQNDGWCHLCRFFRSGVQTLINTHDTYESSRPLRTLSNSNNHLNLHPPKEYEFEETSSEIPAIVMVMMIVLACLVTLAICIALFGLFSWRKRSSPPRNSRSAPNESRTIHNRETTANPNSERNFPITLDSEREFQLFQENPSNIENLPPPYENIVRFEDKDLPSYDQVVRESSAT